MQNREKQSGWSSRGTKPGEQDIKALKAELQAVEKAYEEAPEEERQALDERIQVKRKTYRNACERARRRAKRKARENDDVVKPSAKRKRKDIHPTVYANVPPDQIQNVPISSPSIMNNLYQSAEEGHSSGPPTIVNTVEDRFNQLTYLTGDEASLIKTIENYKSLGVVNDTNTKGETLAILAAQQNRPDIISALSLYGDADLNQSDSNHLSPLLAAAQRGHKETVV